MKETYTKPEVVVTGMDLDDVIAISGDTPFVDVLNPGNGGGGFGW